MTQIKWKRVSESRYWEMLEILPPAVMSGDGFMVGEPWDHNAEGKPRFAAFVKRNGRYFEASAPMTIKEFRTFDRDAADYSYSEETTLLG